jgi:hypothetical protein
MRGMSQWCPFFISFCGALKLHSLALRLSDCLSHWRSLVVELSLVK